MHTCCLDIAGSYIPLLLMEEFYYFFILAIQSVEFTAKLNKSGAFYKCSIKDYWQQRTDQNYKTYEIRRKEVENLLNQSGIRGK